MYNENARYFQNLTSYFHVPTKQHLYADAVQFIVNVEWAREPIRICVLTGELGL